MRTPNALFSAIALAAACASAPAAAQAFDRDRGGEQSSARAQMEAGRIMPIRDIERRIIPQMRESDEYIGFEYDPEVQAYRLKFIRNGRMIWVDVDARSARILRYSR
ncbi:hypothetical protein [Erythrobacter sp. EC-HK427]|uniref:hypothetical protein n=1 Tax=Erythrobacter sp. EC-HK427 TaxID=2038396 RepID=UPI001257DAD8|nr:hypothetical protein [Erythrobacter sp. EC-HK427]VVT18624.1 conserved exported hypothetical protein [Erythrobacter sp. EC-HK427]